MNVKKTFKAEHCNVRRKQNSQFPVTAFNNLTFAVACVEENSSPLNWQDVSYLFYELEIAFDHNFHHVDMSKITGTDELNIQNNVDAILRTKQSKLALALLESDAALAQRYAAVLRGVIKPLGLSEVEKRTAFLQEIERRVPKHKAKKKTAKDSEQIALMAAEKTLAAVSPALRCSKLNPDRGPNDDLVQAFTLDRNNHPTDKDTFKRLAMMDLEKASKDGQGIWLRRSEAVKLYTAAVQGKMITGQIIDVRSETLRKRYARAIKQANRRTSKK